MTNLIVPCANLGGDAAIMKQQLMEAFEKVIDSGMYILSTEVEAFEQEFASYCGTTFAVGVDNGTSALTLLLRAFGIGPGHEVITAPNSFIASASSIALVGARPVFVDISPDLNIDPELISPAVTPRTKAILPVHLTGRPAKMGRILDIAREHGLYVIEDVAQAVGAELNGKRVGSFGIASGFSLHPLKNLHAFGDGGVITLDDPERTDWLRRARNHGFRNRVECEFFSHNCRLDELQAALLRVQLTYLEDCTRLRREKAFRYNAALSDLVQVPVEGEGETCVFQTYMIQGKNRDALMKHLLEGGIEVRINYPIPIHRQRAAEYLGYSESDFPETERACREILSLPLYPSLSEAQQEHVIRLIRNFYGG